jgi:hypothetical protein
MKENPGMVKRFVKASLRGWEYTLKNPEEAIDILAKHRPEVDKPLLLANLKLVIDLFRTNRYKQHGIGWVEDKKMADSMRWKSILLVTSFSHMKRALMAFENFGLRIYPAPADPYEKYTDDPVGRLRLLPVLVHEYVGILYYKVRGWI